MVSELVEQLQKRADFLDISNMLFFSNHFGMVLENSQQNVVHFHGDYRIDFRAVINYESVDLKRSRVRHLKLEDLISDENLLYEIEDILQGNKKSADIKVMQKQLFTFIYINIDLPNRNPREAYPTIVSESSSPDAKTGLQKLKKTVQKLNLSRNILSGFKEFKSGSSIFSKAFTPGLSKVSILARLIFSYQTHKLKFSSSRPTPLAQVWLLSWTSI